MKKILIVLDGASDLGVSCFGGRTPLEVADTPNLDFFADGGKMGYMYPLGDEIVPGSDNALVSIFGNDPRICKRGVFEAIGAGFKLKRGDLALRTNFGTIENLKNRKVVDRRAGRTLSSNEARELGDALNKGVKLSNNVNFEFKPTIQHRGVLVLRGGFSDMISNVDSEWSGNGKNGESFRFSKSLDDLEVSEKTAEILNEFIEQAFKILNGHRVNLERVRRGLMPANMVFMRGGGVEIPKLKRYGNWMSINSMPLEIGLAEIMGMKNFSFDYPELKGIDVYDNLYRGLNKSIKFAIKTIKRNHKDFSGCYIQFKEIDVPGHDNKPYEKRKMIEIIDKKFFGFLRKFVVKRGVRVVVTCDHSTPCKLKAHSSDAVPVLVWGLGKDDMKEFSEVEARKGEMGKMYGKEFMEKVGLVG